LRLKKELVIKQISENNGYFYICGSTKMGADVMTVLKEFIGEDGYKELEKSKRLIKELWGWESLLDILFEKVGLNEI